MTVVISSLKDIVDPSVFRHTLCMIPVESDKKGIGIIMNHGFKRIPYYSGSIVTNTEFKKYS